MRFNIGVGALAALLGLAMPRVLAAIFTNDSNMIDMTVPALRLLLLFFPLVGFTITNSNFFQSIDKPFIAIITSLSRQVIFLLPMIYIIPLIFERFSAPGLMGIWTACAISDVLGAILAAILLSTQLNVFRKKSNFDEI